MESTPRRRWFRFAFSLRTLFIVVTIFGVWLGWNLKIVRERKALLDKLTRTNVYSIEYGGIDGIVRIDPDDFFEQRVSQLGNGWETERISTLRFLRPSNRNSYCKLKTDFPKLQFKYSGMVPRKDIANWHFGKHLTNPSPSAGRIAATSSKPA